MCLLLAIKTSSSGQGRIVVNEFMAWSGCNTSSEFIEIMNFGPGPMNIGCYIITNGSYSVTIPPNTILKAGQYFVLSGQDVLLKDCGNVDSAISVNLNWNTCNCLDKPITSPDGFMTDGGSANEKVVIFDPNLNIIDAVSRKLPESSSVSITTSSLSGACTSKTFDLDLLAISYENIGQSTGINNSYSRKVDGDCGWDKTPAISAKASNKTGSSSSAAYTFSTLSAAECNSTTGSIAITVNSTDLSSLFPMNYLLAFDADSNGVFTSADTYLYGVDSTAPNINISNLAYGRYRITVSSVLGCNLKSFDFMIFNCYGILLPLKLLSFKYAGIENDEYNFAANITGLDNLKSLELEGYDGGSYKSISKITDVLSQYANGFINIKTRQSYQYYRLKMTDVKGAVTYSPIITMRKQITYNESRLWPNPASSILNINVLSTNEGIKTYSIKNANGAQVKSGKLYFQKGVNTATLFTNELLPGVYQIAIPQETGNQPISFRFVKQ